ncbi:uncharacterized protein LOC133195162 [Saccostrea echinata]|uniref:uncharacterized protein LOC133195162 n=1 Tax=Saccostrea echinata TaxID=191078 RepID=UPI002A7F9781|nr:uncharacterized protein LOC133195162 [Saccostrea echinata]
MYFLASSQNLQIQVVPQTVDIEEVDLTIVCSLNNPSKVKTLYFIQLQRNFHLFRKCGLYYSEFKQFSRRDNVSRLNFTTATESLKPPSAAELRLPFTKENVRCPDDFKEYRCKMSGLDSTSDMIPEQESDPVKIDYRVQPNIIEIPRVRILGEQFDTNERQFEVGTALQLTCTGKIGRDPSAVCVKHFKR